MKNPENLSIVVQWDEVDNFLATTTYIVTWTSERDHITHPVTRIKQSSYTITNLTLDTVYTITVTAANRCGTGPEYSTNIILIVTISNIIPTDSIAPVTTAINAILLLPSLILLYQLHNVIIQLVQLVSILTQVKYDKFNK